MIKSRTFLFFARLFSLAGNRPAAARLVKKSIATQPNPDSSQYRRVASYLRLNGEFDEAAQNDIKKLDATRLKRLATPQQAQAYLALCVTPDAPESRLPAKFSSQGTEKEAAGGPVILSLVAKQIDKAGKVVVEVTLAVFDGITVETLWIKSGDEWLEFGAFERCDSIPDIAGVQTYQKRIELTQLANQLPHFSLSKETDSDNETSGRLHCYVQVSSAKGIFPKGSTEVQVMEDGAIRYRYPMGKAWITQSEGFKPVPQPTGELTPYINKSGFVSVAVGGLPKPSIKIYNDGLNVTDGCLNIHGRVFARYASLTEAKLVLLGRTSGYRRVTSVDWNFRHGYSKRLKEKWAYLFSAKYDFSQDLHVISDDVVDLYLEMQSVESAEPIRQRIGKTNPRTRQKTQGGVVKNYKKTLSIRPYYTYQARYPALQFEVFERAAYYHLVKQLKKPVKRLKRNPRPVWLIGEMHYKAQDNGLHFFRYMRDKHPEIDAYYVIDPNSPEKLNLIDYDHVVEFRSKEHISIALKSDALIGTHSVHHLLPTIDNKFRRKIKAKTIFLQHGVIAQKWMAPVYGKKNKSGFTADQVIVSSQREKEFIVHDLGFHPDQVSVTGLARFDALFSNDVAINPKQLFIMPTWRPWLQDNETFQKSDYYSYWMGLLTGKALKKLAEKYNLELVFCLHPNMRQYSDLFKKSGARVVTQGEIDVQYLIKQSAVLLTDFSSVAMDFSFLHKPVIYYQFDANRFPKPHAETMSELPGPIVNNEASVVRCLDTAFANNGRMKEKYQQRADRFIAHRDTRNCERIFEATNQPVYGPSLQERLIESEKVKRVYKKWRKHSSYHPIMRWAYRAMRWLPMDENILVFENNLARNFGDNPLAIYNELVRQGDTRKKVVVCNKPVRHYDKNTHVIKRHSPAFMYYMARSKYWVNSQQFPYYLHRRKKGVYVQTWHGTPLKRMMFDQDNHHGRDPSFVGRTIQSVAQWSILVSPNPHTTKAMQSAFRFTGPIKELGYPRNDVLMSDKRHQLATNVRHYLGIGDSKFVVFYAPTFRDDQPTQRGRFRFVFDWPFDPYQWVNEVGDDVVLLVRTHNLISNKLEIPEELRNNIIDVTTYPDVQELFLASDMLVTDYSSVFFDYAILQRPILFYAYDLDNYRENLRGFYLDYENELPGPIVTDSKILFEKIKEYENLATRPKQPISPAFLERFAPHEDGQASARVIDQLLGGVQ